MAAVGIDRYPAWPVLDNAVRDARGAVEVFQRLGFEQIVAPLYDEAATADAIRRLVTDDLATLRSDDSLVLFFAGHGHTQTRTLQTGPVQTGYLIPVDGDRPDGRTASWLRLDSLLSDVARLPARHILVILDACHSGIVLDSVIKWRGGADPARGESLDALRRRQSRRVITSALGDQRAMDSGPIHGHSLFTGCLIEGLTGGLARDGRREATGSELGLYVQQRVTSYTRSQQTPDFGTLELDHRGELVLAISTDARSPAQPDRPGDPAPVAPSRSARLEPGAGAPVQRDGGNAPGRRVAPVGQRVDAWIARAPTWLGIAFGCLLAVAFVRTWTIHARFAGLQAIAAALAVALGIALVIVVGRREPVRPAFLRSLRAGLLRRKRGLSAAGFIVVLGIVLGTCARAQLDEECSRQLANPHTPPQSSQFGISSKFLDAAQACELIGRARS